MNRMQKLGEPSKFKVYIYTNKINRKKYVGATTQGIKARAVLNSEFSYCPMCGQQK